MSKNKDSNHNNTYIKFLAGVIKEIGLTGFIVVIIVMVFLTWGTVEQKREFIDTFILLKHVNQNPFSCAIVVIGLIFLMIIGAIYSSKMSNLRKEENNRIGKEKSLLQEALLKKKLKSSD